MAYDKVVRDEGSKERLQTKGRNPGIGFVDARQATTQMKILQSAMASSSQVQGHIALQNTMQNAVGSQESMFRSPQSNVPLQAKAEVVQKKLMKDNGTDMSDAELETAISTQGASADEAAYLRYRHGLGGRFYFSTVFRQARSGQRAPDSNRVSARTAAGYVNPSHTASSVRPLFLDAALSPRDTSRDEDDWLFSPSRRFEVHTPTHTSAPGVVHGHSNTVMGHGPVDAVDDWNSTGHTRPRTTNLAHNRDHNIYHGLEDAHRSAVSGGHTTSRYMDPSPALGSHPSHFDEAQAYPGAPWPLYRLVNGTYVPVASAPAASSSATVMPTGVTPTPTATPASATAPAPFWMAPSSAPMFSNHLDSDSEEDSSDSQ